MMQKISRPRRWAISFMAMAALVPGTMLVPGCVPVLVGAAAVTTIVVVTDRRTAGTQLDDTAMATKIAYNVQNTYGDKVHVNVSSYNGIILLTGEVPDQETLGGVESIAASEEKMRAVQNELVIAPLSDRDSRGEDALITSKVKAKFVEKGFTFSPTRVKVVTERGTVYLMGLLSKEEGEKAVDITRRVSGVKRVVHIFEYIR